MKLLIQYLKSMSINILLFVIFFVGLQMCFGHLPQDMGGLMPLSQKYVIIAFVAIGASMLVIIALEILIKLITLVGALLMGFKFLSLNIFGLFVGKKDGVIKIGYRNNLQGLHLGLPIEETKSKVPFLWLYISSPIVMILLTIVSLYCLITLSINVENYISLFVYCIFLFLFFNCVKNLALDIYRALNNYKKNAHFSNLSTIILLNREPDYVKKLCNMFQINTLLYKGKRLGEMPEYLFEDTPLNENSCSFDVLCRCNYINRLLCLAKYEEAQKAINADKFNTETPQIMLILLYRLSTELYASRSPEALKPYCTKAFVDYLQKTENYHLLYALQVFCMRDISEAEKARKSFENYNFFLKEDEASATELVNFIDQLSESGEIPEFDIATLAFAPNPKKNRASIVKMLAINFLLAIILYSWVESNYQVKNTNPVMNFNQNKIDESDAFMDAYILLLKENMRGAIQSSDCDSIDEVIDEVEGYKNMLKGCSSDVVKCFIDDEFISLEKQCLKHKKELKCDSEITQGEKPDK